MANQEAIFETVKAIIVDQLGVDEDEVTMEASFRDDLDADSLDLVELIMAFEEQFGGEISDEAGAEDHHRRRGREVPGGTRRARPDLLPATSPGRQTSGRHLDARFRCLTEG